MAYDEGLAERIRDVVIDRPAVVEKKMFGGIAFMHRNYMFCGVIDDMLMARVGPDNYPNSLSQPHVREMDFTGRKMKGYVYVAPEGIESDDDLAYWVNLCAEFVESLPPKKPKKKKASRK
ncbi:MAG: RNA methyltransferase [Chloroflexi bacterium]|nr:MAG: RNA methyltransferase [Chloroflexota bacterium]